jgi:hypothetical protein
VLQLLKSIKEKTWGEMPLNNRSGWRRSFTPSDITLSGKHIVSISGFDINSMTDSEVAAKSEHIFNSFKNLYSKQVYRIVCINRQGYAKVCLPKHQTKKADFLLEYERFLNSNVSVRHRSTYMLFDRDDNVTTQMKAAGLNIKTDARTDFYEDMAYFFGGNTQSPFFYPIEEWDYGPKIGSMYGVTLMHLAAVEKVNNFAHHILNYINDDYIFTMTFHFPTLFESERHLSSVLSSESQKVTKAAREIEHELSEMLKETELGRESLVCLTSTLTIFSSSPKAALKNAKALSSQLKNYNLSYEIEKTIEFDAFMCLFQPNIEHAKNNNLIRMYPVRTSVMLLPFSTEFKGAPSGELFLNAALEPVYIDPYYASSMHCTTLGHTGSGKSALAQGRDLYCDLLAVIEKIQDDEGSYRFSVPFFGGQYAPISLDRPLSVNCFGDRIVMPDYIKFVEDIGCHYSDFSEKDLSMLEDVFDSVYDESLKTIGKDHLIEEIGKYSGTEFLSYKISKASWERWPMQTTINRKKLAFVVSILKLMAIGHEETIQSEEVSILEQASLKAYDSKPKGRTLGTTEIVRALESMGEKNFANRLKSFTINGRYGQLFDRPKDVGKKDTYYELRIGDMEVVLPVILSILYHTLEVFSYPEHFGKRKKIRLDEAWFFKHPSLKGLVDEMLRTFRKKGIELDFDSQMASDFSGSEGAVISGQCEHNFFLFNKRESIPDVQKAFQLTEKEAAILADIKSPRQYGNKLSELYLKTTYGRGRLYFIPSKKLYWLLTTNPADKIKREEAKAKAHDAYEAIDMLAKEDG